jgi:NAD(P)-dependent dehydrogenase (short-subunit alcohol dehydrogenase family)
VADLNEAAGGAITQETGATFVRTNVCDQEDIARAVDTAAAGGNLRYVVNTAGVSRSQRLVARDGELLPVSEFLDHVQINLVGTFSVCRLAAPAIAQSPVVDGRPRGAIVNVGSTAAFEGQVGQICYSASKGGVVSMTLPLARDLAPLGIRVNTVVPGLFDTPIYGEGAEAEQFKGALVASAILPKRLGQPSEFASMVLELLSNDYMNGETVRVDGAVRLPAK